MMKNPYMRRSHLHSKKSREIIRCFQIDLTADKTAQITSLHVNTIEKRFTYIRHAIYRYGINEDKEIWKGTIEIDESYFGPRRIRGKRGRGAGDKVKVLGLLKREGKVYVQIVPDCSARSLLPVIRGKVDPHSEVNTDGWRTYDGLIDLGYEKHYRVHHGNNEFVRGKRHINGIESFWSFTKRRLTKFNGVPKHKFALYLKECEFRFNCGLQKEDIYKKLLFILKSFASSL